MWSSWAVGEDHPPETVAVFEQIGRSREMM